MPTSPSEINEGDDPDRLKIGNWLWRRFYARLWWVAVTFYWATMAASSRVELLSVLCNSAFAGFMNVFFFPPLVALILSYGFFKAWLATAEFDPDFDPDGHAEEFFAQRRERYGPSGMLREFDPLDPMSGSNWVGSPLNPSHPFYVIRRRHSS